MGARLAELPALDMRKNCLNTLKVIAALQVAYLHIITHLSVTMPDMVTKIFVFFMGVPIFFTLSGFLIWTSIDKSRNFKQYAKKRVTRIFPELWLGVIIEIILLIVFLWDSINWLMLALFAACQGSFLQFWTPESLKAYGCGTPNGTLWTLGITIQFYIAVWFIHKILRKRNIYWWTSALIISVAIKALSPATIAILPGVIGKLYGQTLLPYLWMFMLGAFIAQYKEKMIPLLRRFWWILIALSLVVAYFKVDIGFQNYGVITYALRVPGLIGLCYNLPMLNIPLDFSYGMFIYHMIVVNLMIELGFVGKIYHFFIALAISVILSVLSAIFGKYAAELLAKKVKTEIKNANQT